MTRTAADETSGRSLNQGTALDARERVQTIPYFVLTVLGFSFWFFMAVPFASHRESYWWLAMVQSHDFSHAFSFISSTYRPLHQAVTWLAFLILDPRVFPTSVFRQTVFQLLIYAMFVLAWWLIYRAAAQRRLLALVALLAGGVFFSGYVQLFHIYGLSYVPAILTLGGLLGMHASNSSRKHEVWLALIATVLVLWHPFTTALFVGFYFGHYLETFRQRGMAQHVQALLILSIGTIATVIFVIALPHLWSGVSPLLVETATRPMATRLFAWLVSYQTNEVNRIASFVAFVISQLVILSLPISTRMKLAAVALVTALAVALFVKGLPLLLLWLAVVLVKLTILRTWSLFFLAVTAVLLPLGGGIGTPIHALFAIVVAVYATPLGWFRAEGVLSSIKTRYVVGASLAAAMVLLVVRSGIELPIVTRLATPLLAERERTYQLEDALAWLHQSNYCDSQIDFTEQAGNPIDSVESAITRRNRPPAALADVRLFWIPSCSARNPATRCRPQS